MTKKKKRITSEDVGRLIVEGINEQLRLHEAQIHMVFTKISLYEEDNSAEMVMQFMNTNLSVILPFVAWSDWCRMTLMEPVEYRWYGEMEAQARQMMDLWKQNVAHTNISEAFKHIAVENKENTVRVQKKSK